MPVTVAPSAPVDAKPTPPEAATRPLRETPAERPPEAIAKTPAKAAEPETPLASGNVPEPPSDPPASPHTVSRSHRADRYKDIYHDVIWACVFTGVLLGLNLLLEKVELGERLKILAYNAIQHRLQAPVDKSKLPVVVVDISELPGTVGHVLTSRTELTALIAAIARKGPKAIGLDIDCSPQPAENGDALPVLTESEEKFLKDCDDLSTRPHDPVPVFLGVDRTATGPSDDWLWSPKYAHMAAMLRTPTDERFTMWKWLEVKGRDKRLKSISAALADAAEHDDKEKHRELPPWLHWALESEEETTLPGGIRVERFLVNYGALETLAEPPTITMAAIMHDEPMYTSLHDKVVLIGNSSEDTTDKMVAPDRTKAFPGVLIHACAVNTLLDHPLYEPTLAGRIVADLLLGSIILAVITARKIWNVMRDRRIPPTRQLDTMTNWLTAMILVVTFVGGVSFVQRTHIIWDDFPLVAIGLLYHPHVEKYLHKLVHGRYKPQAAGDHDHGSGSAEIEE